MKIKYTSTINSIMKAIDGDLLFGYPDQKISTITSDSREIDKSNLFIPLIGEKYNGHLFIEELAKKKNIVGFLTIREEDRKIAEENNTSAILCGNTLHALGRIALHHRNSIAPTVIGITGTNGKTTTKELLYSILENRFNCHKNKKNYNNEIGVPFTVLGLKKKHEIAIIEMGMNHSGELDRLSEITRPDISIITNVGVGHLQYLKSIENISKAKSEIMNGMKSGSRIFLNRDTQCYNILHDIASSRDLKITTFGLSTCSDIKPEWYKLDHNKIEIKLMNEIYEIPLYGVHNVYNVVGAIAIAKEFGMENKQIKVALKNFINVDMRSQLIEKDFTIINDVYNSNPLSSKYALLSANEIFPDRRKIAVLSDMNELGEYSESYHQEIGQLIFKHGFDILCTWGEMAKDIAKGAKNAGMKEKNIASFTDKNDLIDFILDNLTKNDVILIKGSRSMNMEEVVDAIIH